MSRFQILLVDDSQAEAQIFQHALNEGSIRARAYWVASGREAIDFLCQRGRFQGVGPVQVIVLDLHIPGEDGFSILRAIKSNPDLNRIPVLILSSSNAQSEIDLAYSLGANAFFRKPMSLSAQIDLVQVLTKHWLDVAQLPSSSGGHLSSIHVETEQRPESHGN